MRIRLIAVAGLVLAVATSTVAVAAPKAASKTAPLCKLVVDPPNDLLSGAFLDPRLAPVGRPYDPALDILSADVASDANTLTGVIRVAKLTVGDPLAPTGRIYRLEWKVRSTGQGGYLVAQITPTGNLFQLGSGTGVVDTVKNEVRISVPISRLIDSAAFGQPGQALLNLNAITDLAYPVVPVAGAQQMPIGLTLIGGDGTALTGAKPYPLGAPSCVKVGA